MVTRASGAAGVLALALLSLVQCVRTTKPRAVIADGSATDRPRCVMGAFSAPTSLTSLNSPAIEWSPSISADGLTLYWSSNRSDGKGGHDIWTARRPSAAADFGTPTNLAEVNTVNDELEPSISADGTELYLYRFRPADDTSLLLRSTRASPAAPFSSPVPLPIFGSSFFDTSGPWLSSDGLQLYLTVQTAKAAPLELAVARRPTLADGFSLVRLLSEVNGPATDGWPTLSSDERELFYETDRDGKARIYTARRDDKGQPFSTPEPAVELNGSRDCGDPDLSRDGRTIYLAVWVGPKDHDLWMATRECQ